MSPSSLLYPGCNDGTYSAPWDGSCSCNSGGYGYHCDIASGWCSVGASPYADPVLQVCPPSGKLALNDTAGLALFNSMCYVSAAWACKGQPQASCRAAQVQAAEGPYPCRYFCSASPFNDDNQLAQLGDSELCVCEVGVQLGGGPPALLDQPYRMLAPATAPPPPDSPTRLPQPKRSMLEFDDSSRPCG